MNVGDECVLAELKPELTIEAVPEAVLEFVIEGNGPKRCGELATSEDEEDGGVIEEFVKVDALKIDELNAGTCGVTNGLEEVWGRNEVEEVWGANGLEQVFKVNGFEEVWGRNEVDKVWRVNGFEGVEEN